jgi:arylsulfatase A-like enzyme
MRRRTPLTAASAALGTIAIVVICAAATFAPVIEPLAVATAATRPNVLVIVTDDQRADTMGVMARTRAWFADGARFPNAVTPTPLCCPARSSIFTGRYAHNHGVRTNSDRSQTGALDQRVTIQAYLDRAGYRTAIAGKYFNAWPLATPPPHFDRYATLTYSTAYWEPKMNVNGRVRQVSGYTTDIVGDRAVSFLDTFERRDADPWFLYLAPTAPHKPFAAEPQHAAADVGTWAGNPAVAEADRSDKPAFVRSGTATLDDGRRTRAKQLRTLLSVDEMVYRVLTHVAANGEGDTLVVFTSDNGYLWGEHGLNEQKRLPYLQSAEVPMLLRWPGHVAASEDSRLVSLIDLAPTILDAAGIAQDPALPPMDGISMLSTYARRRILVEYFRSPDATAYPSWAATLSPNSEYVEYYADDERSVVFREYYDLVADPWQNQNVFADGVPGNEPDVGALAAALSADRACAGATCAT